jgi:NADH-quinone oxidoreductase subunit M
MSNLTLYLLLWPALAGLLILFIKGQNAKKVALGAAVVEFVMAMVAMMQFEPNAQRQFAFDYPWIANFGINFSLGMDGISLLMVFLTAFLVPLIILASFPHSYKNPNVFYALVLFMQTGLIGVFTSFDAFLFYFFWEVALIPIYFLAGVWGGERRIAITFKFFLYTIIGSLFMLVGFIYLYYQTPGSHTSDINAFYQLTLSTGEQGWIFWFLFIAFAIKMPVFPFHTWQPDTYTESPTPATMLLSGIMLKMGIYGVIRWLLPVVPQGVSQWDEIVVVLSIIGIVYGAVIAIRQRDLKRLIAYSSISHVGLIAAGIFTLTEHGMQGGIIQMLSHGVNVVGLFFIIDIIYRRTHTRDITHLGGLTQASPALSIFFMILLLGTVALPLTNGFVGEFLLLSGVYQYNGWLGAIAGLTIILGAVYMLRMFQGVMFGEQSTHAVGFRDLTGTEKMVLVPLVVMVFWIGLHPNTFLSLTEPTVGHLLGIINR